MSIGISAQNSICGIDGIEVGIQANLGRSFSKLNIGVLLESSAPPVFWSGLMFADSDCGALLGPYFKIGIPAFDYFRFQYITNEWICCSPARGYLEAELKVPVCSTPTLRFGSTRFFYLGLGYYKKSCGPEKASIIIGLTNLWYGQSFSSGMWIEGTIHKIEAGLTFGLWDH
ncbi:MAG: hypothetical protein U9Q96_02000 [Patescibacteria group bacterium]|nr:hypothetical protein [Patescibacteria group bacterium]